MAAPDRPRRLRLFRLVIRVMDLILLVPVAQRRYLIGPLPANGPLLVVSNRVSGLGSIALAAAIIRAGRVPRFVITADALRWPMIGRVMRYFDQVRLDRRATGADPLDPFRAALGRGECIVLYTDTEVAQRNPGGTDEEPPPPPAWPGALATEFGVPVVPVAQWGAQYVLSRGRAGRRRRLPRRARIVVTSLPVMSAPREPGPLEARRFSGRVSDAISTAVQRVAEVLEPRR